MKSLLGRVAFRSSETPSVGSYDDVASEYYDERLHPTCADFRDASRIFLRAFFQKEKPEGRIADLGCGLSLLREVVLGSLVLVDSSAQMLGRNVSAVEKRLADVEASSFGDAEFDWIFAILADPYNSSLAWLNIARALKSGGRCLFIVPSHRWVSQFRSIASGEQIGYARFDRSDNSSVLLPSKVYSQVEQVSLIHSVSMRTIDCGHVFVRELTNIRSRKISEFLASDDPLLDVYYAERCRELR
jgi:SAM-dependent methyltransferase